MLRNSELTSKGKLKFNDLLRLVSLANGQTQHEVVTAVEQRKKWIKIQTPVIAQFRTASCKAPLGTE